MTIQRPEFVIFYAWQSDRPGSRNRYFIQDAATEAAAKLSSEPDSPFTLRIDQDTQGVPGLCDIPATILAKIDAADAFLCDLTYVAASEPDGESDEDFKPRHCSNPNVLFELGYAFRSLEPKRILCVMNEHDGPVAGQIFDLAHRRRPLVYRFPNDSLSRKEVKDSLVAKLIDAIRHLLPLGKKSAASSINRIQDIRTLFEARVRGRKFHDLVRRGGAIAIAVIPSPGLQLAHHEMRLQHVPPPGLTGWNPEIRGRSIVSLGGVDEEQCSITEFRNDGVLLGADTYILDPHYHPLKHLIVPSSATEHAIIGTVTSFCEVLTKLSAPLPWTVCVSLLEIKDHWLFVSDSQTSRRSFSEADIVFEPMTVTNPTEVAEYGKVAKFLRPMIDQLWQEFGFAGSLHYTEGGVYNMRF